MCVVFVAFHFMMTPNEKTCEKSQLILTTVVTSKTTIQWPIGYSIRMLPTHRVTSSSRQIIVLHERLVDYRLGLFTGYISNRRRISV